MTTLQITNGINTFDYQYGMIDDWKECSSFRSMENQLGKIIPTLTPVQALEVYNNLTEFHKSQKFGKLLFSMLPEPTPTAKLKNANKVSLFRNAWSMFKDGLFPSFSKALKAAWNRLKVVSGLRYGVVSFEYVKADGTIRKATGTLSGLSFIPKTNESKSKPEVIKYFDIEVQSFRSFRIDRFIGMVA